MNKFFKCDSFLELKLKSIPVTMDLFFLNNFNVIENSLKLTFDGEKSSIVVKPLSFEKHNHSSLWDITTVVLHKIQRLILFNRQSS